jgi:LPXTG-site transpeptidase (sortase) family protein
MPDYSARKPADDSDYPEVISGPADNDTHAADLIRNKVAAIYSEEPDAKTEIQEVNSESNPSKHQRYMYELSTSGKDLATIQTEWHNYYSNLPAADKHEVWKEFYDSQSNIGGETSDKLSEPSANTKELAVRKHEAATPTRKRRPKKQDLKPKQLSGALKDKVTAGGKLKAKHQVQSLLFGLSMGFLVVFIFLFSFFNEVIIAPFIQPSRVSADTPIIINTAQPAPTSSPEVIIPKINVQIPVDYNETSTSESVIESDLEDGVVHYPTTVEPGQNGNTAFFGHSSNNIFNQGKYKFAFVLLHTLVNGDTFYLTYNDKVYVYKVVNKYIVSPSDIGVLGPVSGYPSTATLITCDPPGTSINRLIVVGEQISPDPSTNVAAPASTASANMSSVTQLPGNGPTLWDRFIDSAIGKLVVLGAVIGALYYAWRKFIHHRPNTI